MLSNQLRASGAAAAMVTAAARRPSRSCVTRAAVAPEKAEAEKPKKVRCARSLRACWMASALCCQPLTDLTTSSAASCLCATPRRCRARRRLRWPTASGR